MAAPASYPKLMLWRHLTPLNTPINKPAETSPSVLVVGGGVIGLTTAWSLLDQGYKVTEGGS